MSNLNSKLHRVMPDVAELNGVLSLTCPTAECAVLAMDLHVNTAGDWEGQPNLSADALRCPACDAPLIPHAFTAAKGAA